MPDFGCNLGLDFNISLKENVHRPIDRLDCREQWEDCQDLRHGEEKHEDDKFPTCVRSTVFITKVVFIATCGDAIIGNADFGGTRGWSELNFKEISKVYEIQWVKFKKRIDWKSGREFSFLSSRCLYSTTRSCEKLSDIIRNPLHIHLQDPNPKVYCSIRYLA